MTAREWLIANRYDEIVQRIDAIEARWKADGKATRRDWWKVLAGNTDGSPRIVAGEPWPILAAAREREGLPPVKGALRRRRETPPPAKGDNPWAGRWVPTT